ncbi:hypothetical protein MNBD_GAMMA01-1309 [hydrothermal vent metagenome]|uniref:HTH cro/C1-type domain-containing protein n=1 Tax=hydrothermal vent metagenome TaxID=652676 RepID=A0A3B0VF53_9ZZZZ
MKGKKELKPHLVGKIMRTRRGELGITQEMLSMETDISIFKITRAENGDNLTLDELYLIGTALHMPTVFDWLRAGEEFK